MSHSRLRQIARHISTTMSDSTKPEALSKPGLVLLTASTPNGIKVSAYLEELKAKGDIPGYEFVNISFSKNEQKSDWFLEVNPNGRIPALLDNREGKGSINVWESASILLYLARVYDKSSEFWFKDDEDKQQELLNWIFFIQGGLGPMQGQANHFNKYAPEKIPYGIKRYQTETRRLYSVYEDHLKKGNEYLVGGKCTIADLCTQPWVRSHDWAGVSLDDFPQLKAWMDRIEERPAFKAGLKIPEQDMKTKMAQDPTLAEKVAQAGSSWIMKAQNEQK